MPRFGSIRSLTALFVAVGASSGCLYGFAGGGLPGNIRTVAILPFDNQTAEPALTQEVSESVTEAMQRRLGLRPSAEATADAVVTGTITRYEPDMLLSQRAGPGGEVAVTRRRVQITLSVQIYDQREDRVLWQRTGISVDGEYEPPRESEGRRVALEKLVADIVDGAQSQW
ncbi:MAG TPA: DUF4136 domain-containing protein [Gemmatimonadales bacterium]|jgi:TolB-like protein